MNRRTPYISPQRPVDTIAETPEPDAISKVKDERGREKEGKSLWLSFSASARGKNGQTGVEGGGDTLDSVVRLGLRPGARHLGYPHR
jgi:hypothetical protein